MGNNKLDMRMSIKNDLSAEELLNNYDQNSLQNILFEYGDIKNSKIIAKEIISYREKKRIRNNEDLFEAIQSISEKKLSYKFLSKLYQAIRIEVNDEINSLKEMLEKSVEFLNSSGRLVIISYHSVEDRLVKNFINKSSFNSDFKITTAGFGLDVVVLEIKLYQPARFDCLVFKHNSMMVFNEDFKWLNFIFLVFNSLLCKLYYLYHTFRLLNFLIHFTQVLVGLF